VRVWLSQRALRLGHWGTCDRLVDAIPSFGSCVWSHYLQAISCCDAALPESGCLPFRS